MRDSEAKLLLERQEVFEKNLSELIQQFSMYADKVARLRDDGDLLATSMLKFAESEATFRTLRAGLIGLAEKLATAQDYRHAQVQRIETKVINELSNYGGICATAKENARKLTNTKETNMSRSSSAGDLTSSSSSAVTLLQVDRFEQKKIYDIKKYMSEFVKIEMHFHTKAIELLTKGYQCIASVDEVADMATFRSEFNLPVLRTSDDASAKLKPPSNSTNSLRRFSSTNLAD